MKDNECGSKCGHLRSSCRAILLLLVVYFIPSMILAGQDAYDQDAYNNELLPNRSAIAANESEVVPSNKLMSFVVKDVSIESALQLFAEKARVGLSFKSEMLPDRKISVSISAGEPHEVLYSILEGTDLSPRLTPERDVLVIQQSDAEEELFVQSTVSGVVTDAQTGDPIPGVNLLIEGTTSGTITDVDGNFELNVPNLDQTLIVSYIGYVTQEVEIDGRNELQIDLVSSVMGLDDVVVTAFGLTRDQRSLGTAIGRVSGEDITRTREVNVARSLAGRVAGLTVSSTASGAAGSSNIVIRGATSLGSHQQPLYVVDGVPIDNSSRGVAFREGTGGTTGGGGIDHGDGISQINPHDIAEISVLKGPNAAALYGQRGAQGVILITTKSGQARTGIGVELNSNVTYGTPLVLPRFQNQYGAGTNGHFRFFRDTNNNAQTYVAWDTAGRPASWTPQLTANHDGPQHPNSWGPRMDGTQVYTWDGRLAPFTPQPGNFKDFYQNELTQDYSVVLSGGDENTLYRLSLNQIDNQGLLPTNDLNRRSVSFRGSHNLSDRLRTEARINYVNQEAFNRPSMGDGGTNIAYQLKAMPRDISLASIQNYQITQEDLDNPYALHGYLGDRRVVGNSKNWTAGLAAENPYWTINNRRNEETRERVMGFVSLAYDFTDWASISLKAGTDSYNDRYYAFNEIGSWGGSIRGGMSDVVERRRENNVDLLLSTEHTVTEDLMASANVGGTYMTRWFNATGHSGTDFVLRDMPVIDNTQIRSTTFGWSEMEIQSLFAFGQFNWKDWLYLDWTARNDWASTLPEDNNSFFYPSLSTSFVWSDAFEIQSNHLTYGSFRASWAQAGASGSPYQLSGAYSLGGNPYLGQPVASFTNNLPFIDLKNELTTSYEVGTDLRFWQGRMHLDATWYHTSTENQILSIDIPYASGYSSRRINAGEITNRGIELMLSGTPVVIPGEFQWEVALTFARNKNEVVELVEGIDRFLIGQSRNVRVFADPGEPFGAIYAPNRWLRDQEGNRLIDPGTGLPIRESGEFLVGNAQPDWTGGIMNTISYHDFVLSSLVDIQKGGQIFSQSGVYMALHGTSKRTLEGREGDLVLDGVVAEQSGGQWVSTGVQNTQQVSAQEYWQLTANEVNAITEEFLYDASYVALREVSLGYNVPVRLINSIGLNSARVSVVGRNLFYFVRNTDGFAPEASQFVLGNSGYGIEQHSMPMTRTIGFNINIQI